VISAESVILESNTDSAFATTDHISILPKYQANGAWLTAEDFFLRGL
jgi:hypothetical protein